MIIRSQDKKTLTNFTQLTDLSIHPNHDYSIYSIVACYPFAIGDDYCNMSIGKYSTEEKAIKVLDMICKFASGVHFETIATDQCERLDGVVFQMPQDSEV